MDLIWMKSACKVVKKLKNAAQMKINLVIYKNIITFATDFESGYLGLVPLDLFCDMIVETSMAAP